MYVEVRSERTVAMARTGARLLRQVGEVVSDVPLFLTAPLYRRWHCTWGATPVETVATMPGDHVLPHAQYRCTRAITIEAPLADVWPWLVQVGGSRAGFYSDDLLDNLGRPSAEVIVPELQHLRWGSGCRCLHGETRPRPPRSGSTGGTRTGDCCGASRTAPGRGR